MSQVIDELDRFERALRDGKRRAAYEAARAAWRACRAPELAELVERAAERFTSRPAPTGRTQKAQLEAWIAAARDRAPYEARRLLALLDEPARAHRGSMVATCLDELVAEEDDPSLTLVACALAGVAGGAVSFGGWGKALTRVFAILERAGDPRAIAALEALSADARENPDARGTSTSASLVERIPKVIAKLQKRLTGKAAGLDAAATRRIDVARALVEGPLPEWADEAIAPSSEDALYDAVLANPDDDGARAVWADALQQRGDPRGELIALQLAAASGTNPKAKAAAEKLVKKHWRAWLGPIAPAIVVSSMKFDRGLLDECETDVRRKTSADAIFSHPHWASVRRLTFEGFGRLTSAMRSLEEANEVPEAGLEDLATAALPRLRVLSVRGTGELKEGRPIGRGVKALAETRGLPSLRSLSLQFERREWRDGPRYRSLADYLWLFGSPCVAALEAFSICGEFADWDRSIVAEALPRIRAASPSLRTIGIEAYGTVLTLKLDAGEAVVRRYGKPIERTPGERAEDSFLTAGRALAVNAGLRFID